MPEVFAEGLNNNSRQAVIDALNARVADTLALTLSVKQAHWNVKGRGFIGFHEMLDEVADRLRDSTDTMAERVVQLGGIARGTVESVQSDTEVEAYPIEETDLPRHVELLADRFVQAGVRLRKSIEDADEAGDEASADIFTEVVRQVDQDAWFIGAHKD